MELLLNGDCVEKIKELPNNSVDMVLMDPPYGTTPCEWDKALNFNILWPEIERVTKEQSAICIFGAEPFSTSLRESNKKLYKYDWYWKKCKSLGANFCHSKNSPIKIIENICVFSKAKINHIGKTKNRMTYNPQGLIECKPVKCGHKHAKASTFRKYIERPSHKKYERTLTGYPSNVLDIGFESKERKNRQHPTQKPLALLEYLIKTYTNEGDTVLDLTMGSGSTGVAARKTGRNFVGIELSEYYFDVAIKRIGECVT